MRRREFIAVLGGAVGAASALPIVARAQPIAMPVIGFMSGRWPEESAGAVAAFHQGLAETGYVDGRNVMVEYRWAEGRYDRLPAMAAATSDLRNAGPRQDRTARHPKMSPERNGGSGALSLSVAHMALRSPGRSRRNTRRRARYCPCQRRAAVHESHDLAEECCHRLTRNRVLRSESSGEGALNSSFCFIDRVEAVSDEVRVTNEVKR